MILRRPRTEQYYLEFQTKYNGFQISVSGLTIPLANSVVPDAHVDKSNYSKLCHYCSYHLMLINKTPLTTQKANLSVHAFRSGLSAWYYRLIPNRVHAQLWHEVIEAFHYSPLRSFLGKGPCHKYFWEYDMSLWEWHRIWWRYLTFKSTFQGETTPRYFYILKRKITY